MVFMRPLNGEEVQNSNRSPKTCYRFQDFMDIAGFWEILVQKISKLDIHLLPVTELRIHWAQREREREKSTYITSHKPYTSFKIKQNWKPIKMSSYMRSNPSITANLARNESIGRTDPFLQSFHHKTWKAPSRATPSISLFDPRPTWKHFTGNNSKLEAL